MMTDEERLKNMTLDELWQLYPIVLAPHNPMWSVWADDEMKSLTALLASATPLINHIGSTSVPDIQAKPIIDILVEVPAQVDFGQIKSLLEGSGYICMSEDSQRLSFNKGYTPAGYAEKVFHVHVHRVGDNDEILFRDYLLSHAETAKEYEILKQSLLPRYKNDRDGYTLAKTDFVRAVVSAVRPLSDLLKIRKITDDKLNFIDLLLIGDEAEVMIMKYLDRGSLYVGSIDSKDVAVIVTAENCDGSVEIKNLAVDAACRCRGIGRKMLEQAEKLNPGKKIILGTGETPSTLRFYQSCGYCYSHRIPGFFTDNYPNEIIEEGVILRDMIYLAKEPGNQPSAE